MAKEIRSKFVLDSKQAQQQVNKLATTIGKYNEQIKSAVKQGRSLNKLQESSRAAIKAHSNAVRGATKVLLRMTEQLKSGTSATRTNTSAQERNTAATNQTVAATDRMGAISRGTSQALIAYSATLGNAAARMRDLEERTNNMVAATTRVGRVTSTTQGQLSRLGGGYAEARRQILLNHGAHQVTQRSLSDFGPAMERVNAANKRAAKDWHDHTNQIISWQSAARIAISLAVHRAILRFAQAMRESVKEAQEFNRRVAEIRTISDRAAASVAQWESRLHSLARAYGVDSIEAAEAAYQALSNQVVETANTIPFLEEQVKLSITAVASLDDSVSATTAIMNAFGLEAGNAAQINATLFKTVELGRLRLSELANTIGRVSILSNQLGISFVEQQAAITLLTRQGIKAEEAITLLRNVELKLVKPTERMSQLFDEWGVSSGQAAISAFGLAGVIEKFAEEADKAGDRSAEMAEIFGRLRAIVGATGLSQKSLREEIEKFGTAGPDAAEAYEESMKSLAKRTDVATQQVKTAFVEGFGRPVLEGILRVTDSFGGADKALDALLVTVRRAVTLWITYRATVATTKAVTVAMSLAMVRQNGTIAFNTAAIYKATAAWRTYQAAQGAATLGITLIVGAMLEGILTFDQFKHSLEAAGEEYGHMVDSLNSDDFEGAIQAHNIALESFQTQVKDTFQAFFNEQARARAASLATSAAIKSAFSDAATNLERVMERSFGVIDDRLKELKRKAEELTRIGEARAERVARERREEALRIERKDALKGATTEEASVRRLIELRDSLADRVVDAIKDDNLIVADELRDSFEALDREITNRLEGLKRRGGAVEDIKRRFREIDPLTGRPRTVTRKVGEKKEDPALERRAIEALAAAEKKRTDFVKERIEAEAAAAERAKEDGKILEDLFKKRKTAADEAKEALKTLTDEKLLGDSKAFEAAFKRAREAVDKGFRTGTLTNEARAEFFTEAEKLRSQVAAEEAEKAKRAVIEKEKEAQEARKQTILKTQQEITAGFIQNEKEVQATIATLARQIGTIDSLLSGTATPIPLPFGEDAAPTFEAAAKEVESLKKQLATLKDVDIPEEKLMRIRSMRDEIERLGNLLAKLDPNLRRRSFLGGLFGDNIPSFFSPERRDGSVLVTGVLTLEQYIKKMTETSTKVGELGQKFKELETKRKANDAAAIDAQTKIAEVLQKQEDAAKKAEDTKVKASQQAIKAAEAEAAALKKIEEQLKRNAAAAAARGEGGGGAAFGRINFLAAGGNPRGTDRLPTMLTEGETVINAGASRRFAPLLAAINKSQPGIEQSTSINFGDISVNTPHGTSADQAEAIIGELQRRARRGLLKL